MKSMILPLIGALLFVTTANALHFEEHPTGWFRYKYNSGDDGYLYCDALDEIPIGAGHYLHDRPAPSGMIGSSWYTADGGGTFVYEETNDVAGLQVGGESVFKGSVEGYGQQLGFSFSDDARGHMGDCPNWDVLLGGARYFGLVA